LVDVPTAMPRPPSTCDGLSIVVFLQQPCPQDGDGKGKMLFDFQQAGPSCAASSTMYCAVTRGTPADALPNKQML
jgi:hypothetical protein